MTCDLGPVRQCNNGWHWQTERYEGHDYEMAVEQCPVWLRAAKRCVVLDDIINDSDSIGLERSNAREELRDRRREMKEAAGRALPPGEPVVSKERIKQTVDEFRKTRGWEEEKSQGFGMCVCGEDSVVMLSEQPLCQSCFDKEIKGLGEAIDALR